MITTAIDAAGRTEVYKDRIFIGLVWIGSVGLWLWSNDDHSYHSAQTKVQAISSLLREVTKTEIFT